MEKGRDLCKMHLQRDREGLVNDCKIPRERYSRNDSAEPSRPPPAGVLVLQRLRSIWKQLHDHYADLLCPNATQCIWSPSDSPATLWMFRLTPFTSLHICEKQFEPVTQRPHIRILMLLQFERLWYNFHGPALQLGIQTRFEAKVEVSWMLWIDAKSVIASFGVGFSIGCQPAF